MVTFTEFCAKDPIARQLVGELLEIQGEPAQYRNQMLEIGKRLATGMAPSLCKNAFSDICVVCAVEDADFLARGLIEQLTESGFGPRIHVLCLWNGEIKGEGVSLSPILREYKEQFDGANPILIVVKSIISGTCSVTTNLTRAIAISTPSTIIVAAPIMLKGAEQRLANEFPSAISAKFEFVHFATETGEEDVIPGVGGLRAERLGLWDSKEKVGYVPQIVKERRAKIYEAARNQ